MAWFGCIGKLPPFDEMVIQLTDTVTSFVIESFDFNSSVSDSVDAVFHTQTTESPTDTISSFEIPSMSFVSATDNVATELTGYLFNYEDVTIYGSPTLIITDVDWDQATFGNKAWRFEYKCTEKTSSGSGLALLGVGGTYAYYGDRDYGGSPVYQTRNNQYVQISQSSHGLNVEVAIEYDGNGTLKVYYDDVLDATINNFDPEYLTDSPSDMTKIYLRAWRFSGTTLANSNYLNYYNGHFDYIRMKFLD